MLHMIAVTCGSHMNGRAENVAELAALNGVSTTGPGSIDPQPEGNASFGSLAPALQSYLKTKYNLDVIIRLMGVSSTGIIEHWAGRGISDIKSASFDPNGHVVAALDALGGATRKWVFWGDGGTDTATPTETLDNYKTALTVLVDYAKSRNVWSILGGNFAGNSDVGAGSPAWSLDIQRMGLADLAVTYANDPEVYMGFNATEFGEHYAYGNADSHLVQHAYSTWVRAHGDSWAIAMLARERIEAE